MPVVTKGLRDQLISDVAIDNETDWREKHWRSLEVSYGKAPFFRNHAPFFEEIYVKKTWQRLADLNVCIIKYIMKELGIDTPLHFESEIGTTRTGTKRIIEICGKLEADVYLSGTGGRDYLDEKRFAENGIELVYQAFEHPVYSQCYAEDESSFLRDMAAIDILFNEGLKSGGILGKGGSQHSGDGNGQQGSDN